MEQVQATVVIPTKNAGERFFQVMEKVLCQDTPWKYEVLVIDSGSSDKTVELVQKLASTDSKLRLVQIPPSQFGHGKTRNLGAKLSHGKYVAFITQDALPANENWLKNLVAPFQKDASVAGVFGRHLAYPSSSKLIQYELSAHFENLNQVKNPLRIEDRERYQKDEGYRQLLHFFSNNNSCLRKDVWEANPFPEVDFAEDQAWARNMIELGYSKAYANDAVVYHSHDYGWIETLRRSYDESRSLHEIFGYRLIQSFQMLLSLIKNCSIADYRYLKSVETYRFKSVLFLQCLILRACKLTGLFLGSRIPGWTYLGSFLSLDQSVKRRPSTLFVVHKYRLFMAGIKRKKGLRKYLEFRQISRITTHWRYGRATDSTNLKEVSTLDFGEAFSQKYDKSYNEKRESVRRAFQGDLSIAWVIPLFDRGGGGHFNIFRCQRFLKEMFGIKSCNFIYPTPQSSHRQDLLEKIIASRARRFYREDVQASEFSLDWSHIEKFPIVMSTAWASAYSILSNQTALLKGYFIQDHEPDFYAEGIRKKMAELTYDFNYYPICAGPWLPSRLGFVKGGPREQPYTSYLLAVDPKQYYPRKQNQKRSGVCFYLRNRTERRGFELALAVIDRLKELDPSLPILTVGMPLDDLKFLGGCNHHGVANLKDLPLIYSKHQLYITFSFTNYSLLPAEIIACQGRVLDLDLECNRMVKEKGAFPEGYYHLASLNPYQVADQILKLVASPPPIEKEFNLPTWESEYKKIGEDLLRVFHR